MQRNHEAQFINIRVEKEGVCGADVSREVGIGGIGDALVAREGWAHGEMTGKSVGTENLRQVKYAKGDADLGLYN